MLSWERDMYVGLLKLHIEEEQLKQKQEKHKSKMSKTINASKLFKRGSGAVSGANKISKFKNSNLLGKRKGG